MLYKIKQILNGRKRKEELAAYGYFDRKIRNTINDLDHQVFMEWQRLQEEENARGTMQSGMAMQRILVMFGDMTIAALKENLKLIKEFQDEMKVTLGKGQLEVIGLKHAELFSFSYLKQIENYYKPMIESMFDSSNITNQLLIDNTYNKIRNIAKDYVADLKVKNVLKKDEPSVKNQKRMFTLAIISLIITNIITLFVKLHK
ncbi:hypothetical protein ACQKOM_10590 [Peribacillus frigoritolerans]|uniref:hypothetical protein n=1 Tax=Peribacillus frigoritolerans TaxID=450367 RepID=UPI003CFF09F1